MRNPIQRQLLMPMLLVVLLASVLASGVSAWVGGRWARREESERLARVVATLTDATFPLQESVLQKMSGLSGAEFVVWDRQQQVQAASLLLDSQASQKFRDLPETGSLSELSSSPMIELSGRSFLAARVPLRRATTGAATLIVLYPEDRWWTATRAAVLPPLVAGGISALIAVVLTTWWAKRFVRPIEELNRQAEAIAGGSFQPMTLPLRDDELRDLTMSINRMVEQLARYEQQVRRQERLKTLGQLGAGLAHQLRNWLAGARLAMQLHTRECPLGLNAESTDTALRQLDLMEAYLQRFLTLGAGRHEPTRVAERLPVSLAPLVDDVLSLIAPRCRHAGVETQWMPPVDPIEVLADRSDLQELLVNLLLNAIDAASRGSAAHWIRVELSWTNETISLRVLDSGSGPSATIAPQLFEPFATDKPEGTGLGLAVAKQIAEDHNGSLTWRRMENATCFELTLPAAT